MAPEAPRGHGPEARRRAGVGARCLLAAVVLLGLLAGPAGAAPPEVTAGGAVLWDPADEKVLYGKEETVGRPMASTTKIMTIMLAIEAGTVDDEVTVSAGAAAQGGASMGLSAGQRLPMRSLLAGLVLRSGNDAAQAVAEHVAGSEVAFVDRMNARAAELGLDSTRFVNPSGLTDDPEHHASPLDLVHLAVHAMVHPDFAAWAGAQHLTVPGLPPMESRNELLGTYPGATGVKTGYTALSGNSLVGSATRDGRTLYTTVLGSANSFLDTARLLDHGFDDFRRVEPLADATGLRYRWSDAEVDLVPVGGLGATVPVDAPVTWRRVVDPAVTRPLRAGDIVGEAQLLVDGEVQQTVALRAASAVSAPRADAATAGAGVAVQDALRAFARLHVADRPA